MSAATHELASRRESYATLLLRFIQKYQSSPNDPLWVFEGREDIEYFSSRIEMEFEAPPGRRVLLGYGKVQVLKLRDMVNEEPLYKTAKVAFFTDADFDDPATIRDEITYVTPCYAIENLYVTDIAIERALTEKLALFDDNVDRADLVVAMQHFIEWRQAFCKVLLPYCASLLLCRVSSVKSNRLVERIKTQLLSQVLDLKIVDSKLVCGERIPLSLTLDEYNDDPNITVSSIMLKVNEFAGTRMDRLHLIVRGKFLIPFLRKALMMLIEDSNRRDRNHYFSKRRPCSHQIREHEILAHLSKYAETPPCLRRFLAALRTRWTSNASNFQLA